MPSIEATPEYRYPPNRNMEYYEFERHVKRYTYITIHTYFYALEHGSDDYSERLYVYWHMLKTLIKIGVEPYCFEDQRRMALINESIDSLIGFDFWA